MDFEEHTILILTSGTLINFTFYLVFVSMRRARPKTRCLIFGRRRKTGIPPVRLNSANFISIAKLLLAKVFIFALNSNNKVLAAQTV